MTISLRRDAAAATVDGLTRVGEVEDKQGFRISEYTNFGLAGVSLSQAKEARLGVRLPKNRTLGNVAELIELTIQLAPRADGTPRFASFSGRQFCPADVTADERTIIAYNAKELINSTEVYTDLMQNFKSAV